MAERTPGTPALSVPRSTRRSRRPAEPGQDALVISTFDGQIAGQRPVGSHVGPRAFDTRDDRGQAGGHDFALGDLDRSAWIRASHDVGATLRNTNIVGNTAARGERAQDGEGAGCRPLSKASHAADTARQWSQFQTRHRPISNLRAAAAAKLGNPLEDV